MDLFDSLAPEDLPPCLNVSRPGTRPPQHTEPTLAIDVPTATRLDAAIAAWRATFTAVQKGQAPERNLVAARHGVVMVARATETREHTIDWLGASKPHLAGAACSCGERTDKFALVDLVALAVVRHVQTGAEL